MNRSQSKYFNTAVLMDQALLEILEKKDFEYITIKEVCQRAGVNRSTFYLHYENMDDLLKETIRYLGEEFQTYFSDVERRDSLYLVTPDYLVPYLTFIREHARAFHTAISKQSVLASQDSMNVISKNVIGPVLDAYGVAEDRRPYIVSFYVEGIIAIIKCWLDGGCQDSIEFIVDLIVSCVQRPDRV